MGKETSFVLKLIEEAGMSAKDAGLVMKHFGDDGRISPRSERFQLELIKLVGKGLIEASRKREEKEAGDKVQKVEVISNEGLE